jgi:hypothetical protein
MLRFVRAEMAESEAARRHLVGPDGQQSSAAAYSVEEDPSMHHGSTATSAVDDLFAAMHGGSNQLQRGRMHHRSNGRVHWPPSTAFDGYDTSDGRRATMTSHQTGDAEISARCMATDSSSTGERVYSAFSGKK